MPKYFLALILILSSNYGFAAPDDDVALWGKYFECLKTMSQISGRTLAESKIVLPLYGKEPLDTLKISEVKTEQGSKEFLVTKNKIIEFTASDVARNTKAELLLLKDNNGQYRSCDTKIGHDESTKPNVNSIKNKMENYVEHLTLSTTQQRKKEIDFLNRNPTVFNDLTACGSSLPQTSSLGRKMANLISLAKAEMDPAALKSAEGAKGAR